eukprot:CAMPEP_0168541394 /NCGR_PEP_ID=MMETSP0413-20121227/794_1 /TAXON_ID=136452 /ORGANISM="Filamoeba nolandi, Strain NC-AS-23-1" /LENGTH=644 /DNA_ID=CAMNT_0008571207 /DNA_START=889 /DNA_END=2823 /DNA_ORIENTATION=-
MKFIIAGCHSLVNVDGKPVGDPLEIASVSAINWNVNTGDQVTSRDGKRQSLHIVQRYHFSSELQRMTTLVTLDHERNRTVLVCLKGAPEKIGEFLDKTTMPKNYVDVYQHFSREGYRVLALAFKQLDSDLTMEKVRQMTREELESDVQFAGFLVFHCPIKQDSHHAVKMLKDSSHKIVMITGDNPLTACSVARTLAILSRPCLVLTSKDINKNEEDNLVWQSIHGNEQHPLAQSVELSKTHQFCVTGTNQAAFQLLFASKYATAPLSSGENILSKIKVYARVSPYQKEQIIYSLNKLGNFTLMCGDGTNDVGALKQAHIGVALLNSAPVTPSAPTSSQSSSQLQSGALLSAKRKAQTTSAPQVRPKNKFLEKLEKELEKEAAEMNTKVLPQLGDASIASPFTARSSSVMSVTHIVRQGRCTLVTTMQMFKILGLNCLISAYSLSVLYLDGIKLGDVQATSAGMLIAMCFLFISKSNPLEKLSAQRPSPTLFSPYMFFSIILQFAVHLFCLISVVNSAKSYSSEPVDPDSEFKPSLVNSGVFLISSAMHVATFAVNHQGHPFMENLWENKPLRFCLSVTWFFSLFLAMELSPEMNEYFELVPFPSEFRTTLLGLIFLDVLGAWGVEIFCKTVLSDGTTRKTKRSN